MAKLKAYQLVSESNNYVGYKETGEILAHSLDEANELVDNLDLEAEMYDLADGMDIESQCEEDGIEFDGFSREVKEIPTSQLVYLDPNTETEPVLLFDNSRTTL